MTAKWLNDYNTQLISIHIPRVGDDDWTFAELTR